MVYDDLGGWDGGGVRGRSKREGRNGKLEVRLKFECISALLRF